MPKNVTLKFDFSKKEQPVTVPVKVEAKPEIKPYVAPVKAKEDEVEPAKTKRFKFKKRKRDNK